MSKHDDLRAFLHTRKVGYNDHDIIETVAYIESSQTSGKYDRLSDWSKMIVNMLPVRGLDRFIPRNA